MIKICLYNEGIDIDISEIASFIKKETELDVETRESLIKSFGKSNSYNFQFPISNFQSLDEIALEFAKAKVCDVNKDIENQPLKQEVEYEKKRLKLKESSGLLYDGFRLQEIFRNQLPKGETSLNYAHIIFTKEFLATYDEGNKRYHLRASLYGFPSLISTSGIIEAPARPREYYLKKMQGMAEEKLKIQFAGRFIDYDSTFIPKILKGYTLQAIFFYITGFPFCDNKDCIAFNAHWQEEMINSHITSGRLCEKHKNILKNS